MSVLLLLTRAPGPVVVQASASPDTVVVPSGSLRLRALLWRPVGRGPFPAVLFNHGSWPTPYPQPVEGQAAVLGPVFARHGYAFLFLFRRGTGLSAGQGVNSADLLDRALADGGQDARNREQVRLLESGDLADARAGLEFLRALPDVDARRVAIAGHSFGGSLTLLVAERDPALRAAIVFAGAAASWAHSPRLRQRLLAAVRRLRAPIFFLHAANDYSVAPGEELAREMARLGKPHRVTIYPPVGRTASEGHNLVHLGVPVWEPDVFGFLDASMRR